MMKKILILLVGSITLFSIQSVAEVRKEDNLARPLLYDLSEPGQDMVWATFLSLHADFCYPLLSVDTAILMLTGQKEGCLSYDKEENKIILAETNIEIPAIELKFVKHSKYGYVASIEGKDGERINKISQRLVRVEGGWLDLNEDWSKEVTTRVFNAEIGDELFVFTLHFVKHSVTIFGYSQLAGKPDETLPIRGEIEGEDELTLYFGEECLILKKKVKDKETFWYKPKRFDEDISVTLSEQ